MENTSMTSLAPHFESILDTLSDGVFISDAEGTTLFVNKMYETLTGLRQGEIRGKNIRTLVQQGIFDKVVNPQIVETGKSATHVQQLANGKRLVLTGYPVFDDKGQLCLVVTFARDITVLTQLQEEMTAQKKLIEQFHDRLAFLAREQTRELVPVFESREMKEVMSLVERFASSDATVLILGETGVGKDVVARLTHELSPRKEKMFLKVDCGGISESLTESELFGYMPGAFTGAGNKGKSGYFEMADGGTVFLDEIGEMPVELQAKLLRVLECGEFIKIGETRPTKVDLRIIAATNRDLEKEIASGNFREDLFFRLSVFRIHLPSLRERPGDIAEYARFFAAQFADRMGRRIDTIDKGYIAALERHAWHGNVRELRNVVERSLIMAEGNALTVGCLSPEFHAASCDGSVPDSMALDALERHHILRVLEYTKGNKAEAARLLGIGIATLYRKLDGYGVK